MTAPYTKFLAGDSVEGQVVQGLLLCLCRRSSCSMLVADVGPEGRERDAPRVEDMRTWWLRILIRPVSYSSVGRGRLPAYLVRPKYLRGARSGWSRHLYCQLLLLTSSNMNGGLLWFNFLTSSLISNNKFNTWWWCYRSSILNPR